jgi:hypothetical protein
MPFGKERGDWMSLWILRIKYYLWVVVTKVMIGIIYVSLISEGLRTIAPGLGQRLYKQPGLNFLKDYKETYRLDLAPILAAFILVAVFYLWERILKIWLSCDDEFEWKHDTILVVGLGSVILVADAICFYCAVAMDGWSGSFISISAFLATVCYIAIVVFVSYITVLLRSAVDSCLLKD